MSVQQKIYVGPYVVATFVNVVQPVKRRTCPDPTCKRNGEVLTSKHCPECGKKACGFKCLPKLK